MDRVEIERWIDTLMLGSLHENNTIDQYKQYGQGGPDGSGMITINEFGYVIGEFTGHELDRFLEDSFKKKR